MIKRLSCIILLLALVCAPFFGSGVKKQPSNTYTPPEEYASALSQMRLTYRESALTAEAVCLDCYKASDGSALCDYEITYVYAGKANEGDVIQVLSDGKTGSEKLLYLKYEESSEAQQAQTENPPSKAQQAQTENPPFYAVLENGEFDILGGRIVLSDGRLMPAEVLDADIYAQEKIKRVPPQYMYYKDFESLVRGCDEIILARVKKITDFCQAECRSSVKGESVNRNCSIAEAELTVLNGFASPRVYGESVSVSIVQEMWDNVIDNESLTVVPRRNADALKAGGIYVFFINSSEDAKSDGYFLVNPYQGYLRLSGEYLYACARNNVLTGTEKLPAFAEKLYSCLGAGAAV